MTASAQRACAGFVRLAGVPDSLLYFPQFFSNGWLELPKPLRCRFRQLESWSGINGLAESVRKLVDCSSESDVLFASRSASLMRLASWQATSLCDRIVTVDLLWPPYRRILEDVCRQTGTELKIIRLRKATRITRVSPVWIRELISDACIRSGAQGVFLPMLTHQGVLIPVRETIRELRRRAELSFVAIDGSQAIGHLPMRVTPDWCDFLIGGSHKWLGGYHPMGIGVTSDPSIKHKLELLLSTRRIDDPMIRLSAELTGMANLRHGETTCLAPLISAQGAINDALKESQRTRLANRVRNRRTLSSMEGFQGWASLQPKESRGHGILHASPPPAIRSLGPERIRQGFRHHQIAVTVYRDSTVRMSLPPTRFTRQDRKQIQEALHSISA